MEVSYNPILYISIEFSFFLAKKMTSPIITYFGTSCFLLEFESLKILVDPGKKGLGRKKGDIVYATHRHFDHTRGIEEFLRYNDESSILISNEQVTQNYVNWGDRVKTIEENETLLLGELTLEFISAKHGMFKGEKNLGIIIRSSDFQFGHLGDGVSFGGFASKKVDILAVPIGGFFTASPKGVINELAKFENPPSTIVPMHWLLRSPKGFCKKISKAYPQMNCIIPKKGEAISY
jgi:L-ascorbate metabolism protein UlaG (beta-lactamase superfamily)